MDRNFLLWRNSVTHFCFEYQKLNYYQAKIIKRSFVGSSYLYYYTTYISDIQYNYKIRGIISRAKLLINMTYRLAKIHSQLRCLYQKWAFHSWKLALSNSVIALPIFVVISVEMNWRRYFQIDSYRWSISRQTFS